MDAQLIAPDPVLRPKSKKTTYLIRQLYSPSFVNKQPASCQTRARSLPLCTSLYDVIGGESHFNFDFEVRKVLAGTARAYIKALKNGIMEPLKSHCAPVPVRIVHGKRPHVCPVATNA